MTDVTDGKTWHVALSAVDLDDEDVEQVWIGDLAIAIYRVGDKFYATQDTCTHAQAYMSDGVVIDCVVECPFHQGRFDIRTGKALGAPVVVPLQTFPVKVDNGQVFVLVDSTATTD